MVSEVAPGRSTMMLRSSPATAIERSRAVENPIIQAKTATTAATTRMVNPVVVERANKLRQ